MDEREAANSRAGGTVRNTQVPHGTWERIRQNLTTVQRKTQAGSCGWRKHRRETKS